MNRKLLVIIPLCLLTLSVTITAKSANAEDDSSTEIVSQSLDALAVAVGLQSNSVVAGPRKLKIAVLDNGFRDFAKARGTTLPATTKLRTGPTAIDPKTEEGHGTKIAEILVNLLDRTGTKYELHLFQAFGFSNLSTAVEAVIKENFDLVLYSQVWEYGGNGDGRGFINRLVNTATDKGVTWVNATGNFAKSTYRAPVERTVDDWAHLPGPNGSVQIRCYPNKTNVCRLRVVLSWNSFSDDVKIGTDKDLDLVLTDDTSKVLHTGGLVQKKTVGPLEQGSSLYPREIIEAEVKPGVYYARVKIRSAGFLKYDELKIMSSGDFIEMLNRTEGETLLPPADNASVISVGASDTDKSSFSRSSAKPDLSTISLIKTADGGQFKGSSNSAAAYAARIAIELSRVKNTDRDSILTTLRGGTPRPKTNPGTSRPNEPTSNIASSSGLASTEVGCYAYRALNITVPHVRKMLRESGVVVETTSGVKVFVDENPFTMASRLGLDVELQNADGTAGSILVADASGLYATSVNQRSALASDVVEFVRTPQGARFCRLR